MQKLSLQFFLQMLNRDNCFWLCLVPGTRRVALTSLPSKQLTISRSLACSPFPTRPHQGQPSWDEWILFFHVPQFRLNPLHAPRGAAGAPWGPAPPSSASWRTDPGTGPSPHLFISRFTWPCREPNPQKSWQGEAGVMLISLCLITAVPKAQCLLHYPGRSEQRWC